MARWVACNRNRPLVVVIVVVGLVLVVVGLSGFRTVPPLGPFAMALTFAGVPTAVTATETPLAAALAAMFAAAFATALLAVELLLRRSWRATSHGADG